MYTRTALPPNLLLAAKLLALWLLVHRGPVWRPRVFLPFLPWLDRLGPAEPLLEALMSAGFLVAVVAILLSRFPRAACLTLGGLVLLSVLADRTTFSNNHTLAGFLLLLIGLHRSGETPWLIRLQVSLVYLGAGVNKLLDPDWQSGVFFEFWSRSILEHDLYARAADLLPPLVLSQAMCWGVIVIELALAAGFLFPRQYRWVIPAGLAFHVSMLVFTGGVLSWLFLYVMAAAYLAALHWPALPVAVGEASPGSPLARVVTALDPGGLYRRRPGPAPGSSLTVWWGRRSWTGGSAAAVLLAVHPLPYVLGALVLLWQPLPSFVRRSIGLIPGL